MVIPLKFKVAGKGRQIVERDLNCKLRVSSALPLVLSVENKEYYLILISISISISVLEVRARGVERVSANVSNLIHEMCQLSVIWLIC